MMDVIRAKRAGFCMGVALALHKLDSMVAARQGEQVATLGDIIHNPQVLDDYARKGVRRLGAASEAQADMAVLIRAHGITRSMEEELRGRCARVEDATCPRVKKAQLAIAEATAPGRELLLYGEADHPEVRGLISYAAGPSHIFSSPEELASLLEGVSFEGRAVVLAAQTTQDRLIFDEMRSDLSSRFGDGELGLLHAGAGGVFHAGTAAAELFLHAPGDAVGADEHGHVGFSLRGGTEAAHALAGIVFQHLRIMDDLAQSGHLLAFAGGDHAVELTKGKGDAHAESGAAGAYDVHHWRVSLGLRGCSLRRSG